MKIIINENQLKELIKKINIRNIISEEIKNKALITNIHKKWELENPNLSIDDVVKIITKFGEKQRDLNPRLPEVFSFLSRYDGNHGYVFFNPENLKDITKYSYSQIKFLLEQYFTTESDNEEEEDNTEIPTDQVFSDKKTLDLSKSLWFGQSNLIIDDNGFRVYAIPNQGTSIRFGYYSAKINDDLQKIYPEKATSGPDREIYSAWCVTWPDTKYSKPNMWRSYRESESRPRTFYFAIDESKDLNLTDDFEKQKYYLGAIQKEGGQSTTGFRLNSVANDGEKELSWEQIVSIYPKLRDHKDLFIEQKFTEEELQSLTRVGQIVENNNSDFDFKKQSRKDKKTYISSGNSIHKPESWNSMDTNLRNFYITSSNQTNILDRFDNFELLYEIKKSNSHYKHLNARLTILGFQGGISFIMKKLMATKYRTSKVNLKNENICIIESIHVNKYGIFDFSTGDFLKKDNISYDPFYNRNTKRYKHLEDGVMKNYAVEEYTLNGIVNEKTFYTIYEKDPKKSHFMSRKGFLKLLSDNPEINLEGDEPINEPNRTFKDKPDSDINEFKRRY